MTVPVEVEPTIDYHDPELPRAWKFAVWFLTEDDRWYKALTRHVPDMDNHGRCARCFTLTWPCLTWQLADAARRVLGIPALPQPRRPE